MKSKKNFLMTIIFTAFVATTSFCAEAPQLSYWQRFKNWISGTSSYAQSMAEVPYEWARNFVSGLTGGEKAALLAALGGFGGEMMRQYKKQGAITPEGLIISSMSGSAASLATSLAAEMTDRYFNAVNLNYTIKQIKKDLENTEKFPDLGSKISALQTMKIEFSTGKNLNFIAYRAACEVLEELLNSTSLKRY